VVLHYPRMRALLRASMIAVAPDLRFVVRGEQGAFVKYGIDPQYIHLGKFSIPTAILGLLPLNVQANPVLAESNKISYQLNSDIRSQAQRGMNEADFRKAVKSIRERKERERNAAANANSGSDTKKQPADPPPAQGSSKN